MTSSFFVHPSQTESSNSADLSMSGTRWLACRMSTRIHSVASIEGWTLGATVTWIPAHMRMSQGGLRTHPQA